MKLLDTEEINTIIKQYGNFKVVDFTLSKYSDTLIGYLGEHLKLAVAVEDNGMRSEFKFFVKCMPKDQWLAEFLIESNFFRKEYVMLSDLFVKFDRHAGIFGNSKWGNHRYFPFRLFGYICFPSNAGHKAFVPLALTYLLERDKFFISDSDIHAIIVTSQEDCAIHLRSLFPNIVIGSRWRPRSLLIKEDLFVFEDATELGYQMARQKDTLNYKEMMAAVTTLAQFHAQSFIYEESKSQELQRPYRIWEDFSEHLLEPKDPIWRNTGRNAVIEFLKVHSRRKSEPNFSKNVSELMISLFDDAFNLMKPSLKYRNTVVHRDIWSNNILIKGDVEKCHALIVDFQTVLYCPPTLDLSSLIYFNTTKDFRDRYVNDILDVYYDVLSKEVEDKIDVDFSTILSKSEFMESYGESALFGMTQAAIIVPITAMSVKKREELFCDPESIHRINNVTRSKEILDVANEDAVYCSRITELFEDIVDRYYPFDKEV